MSTRILLLFLSGLFLVAVAACGSAAAPTPTAAPTDVPTLAPTTAPTETPAPTATDTAVPSPTEEIARPSNPGGPGPAVDLQGDATAGKAVFEANCVKCHAEEGKGGVANPGSDDGTVPPLKPIDETLVSADYKAFATNLDLFIEHGSTPAGSSPVFTMPAWGDTKKLTPQQIADVIAYVISLNK